MSGSLLTMHVIDAAKQPPDADTDVLIWATDSPEATLGAYVDHDAAGTPLWVDAQGAAVSSVSRWAALPMLPMRLQA